METVTGYSPLVNSSFSPVTKQFGLFHDNKSSTLIKQMNNNWTLLPGAYIYDDTVVVGANREQFMLFLPSFVLLCTVLGVGVPGNVLALLVYARKMKKGIARGLFITLCVADLLSCLVVTPFELYLMSHVFSYSDKTSCKLLRWFSYAVNNVTSCVILAIAVERHRVICKPWIQKLSNKTLRMICYCITLSSAVYALPMFFVYGTKPVPLHGQSASHRNKSEWASTEAKLLTISALNKTNISIEHTDDAVAYGHTCSVNNFVINSSLILSVMCAYLSSILIFFGILVYLYANITTKLVCRRNKALTEKNERRKTSTKRIRTVTLMALALALSYVCCYLPCLVCLSIRVFNPNFYYSLTNPGKTIFQLFLKFYLVDSALNPIIYCYCSRDFRRALSAYFVVLNCGKMKSARLSIDTKNAEIVHRPRTNKTGLQGNEVNVPETDYGNNLETSA